METNNTEFKITLTGKKAWLAVMGMTTLALGVIAVAVRLNK